LATADSESLSYVSHTNDKVLEAVIIKQLLFATVAAIGWSGWAMAADTHRL
jgi:hypothetical protein